MYGPFWTLTTLIFALCVCSSLSSAVATYLSHPDAAAEVAYDFRLFSTAVGLVYAYGLGVPVLLWFALRYLGVGEWSVVEAMAVWGYGQFVWIPVAVSYAMFALSMCLTRRCIASMCDPSPAIALDLGWSRISSVGIFPCSKCVPDTCFGKCAHSSHVA